MTRSAPQALDVERLAKALVAVRRLRPHVTALEHAALIAAEYARLASESAA